MMICMRIHTDSHDLHMQIIVNHHDLYMVGKRRFSALKWYLVYENWLRIEAMGAKTNELIPDYMLALGTPLFWIKDK